MPVSFGFHPALRWPLPGGGAKEHHEIVFSELELAPVRRLHAGLLRRRVLIQRPVKGRHLASVRGAVHRGRDVTRLDALPRARLSFTPGARHEGPFPRTCRTSALWSKPGAGFLCIEPWQGHAAPEGFSDELAGEAPGVSI